MYRFIFKCTGEIWEIDDADFAGRSGYWYRSILREVKWYRHYFRENCDVISYVLCYHNGIYYGMLSVGDCLVQWNDNTVTPDGFYSDSRHCSSDRKR